MVVPLVAGVVAPWFPRRGSSTAPPAGSTSLVLARVTLPDGGSTGGCSLQAVAAQVEAGFRGVFLVNRRKGRPPVDAALTSASSSDEDTTDGEGDEKGEERSATTTYAAVPSSQMNRWVDEHLWGPLSPAAMQHLDCLILYVGGHTTGDALRDYADQVQAALPNASAGGEDRVDDEAAAWWARCARFAVLSWRFTERSDGSVSSNRPTSWTDVVSRLALTAEQLVFMCCHVDRLTLHHLCKSAGKAGGNTRLRVFEVTGPGSNISAKGTYEPPRARRPGRMRLRGFGCGDLSADKDTPFGLTSFYAAFPRIQRVVIESYPTATGVQTWDGESLEVFASDPNASLTADERAAMRKLQYTDDLRVSDAEAAIALEAKRRALAALQRGRHMDVLDLQRTLGVSEAVLALPALVPARVARIASGMWTVTNLTLTTTFPCDTPIARMTHDEGVAELAALPALRRLVLLDLPYVRGTGFGALAEQNSPLEQLEIRFTPATCDSDATARMLALDGAFVNDDGAEAISMLPGLKVLVLEHPKELTDEGLCTFAGAAALESLTISGFANVTGRGFGAFRGFGGAVDVPPSPLHTVVLSDERALEVVEKAATGKVLLPKVGGLTATGLAALCCVPNLTCLRITSARLAAPDDWAGLTKLPLLRRLHLHDAIAPYHRAVRSLMQAAAVGLPQLEELRLSVAAGAQPQEPAAFLRTDSQEWDLADLPDRFPQAQILRTDN
jgi:hypothetical protein